MQDKKKMTQSNRRSVQSVEQSRYVGWDLLSNVIFQALRICYKATISFVLIRSNSFTYSH